MVLTFMLFVPEASAQCTGLPGTVCPDGTVYAGKLHTGQSIYVHTL